MKYSGSDEVMIELSEALQSFKASPWEETMDWYQYDDYNFFGQAALNYEGAVDQVKLEKLKKKMVMKVCSIQILILCIILITF